MTRPIPTTEPSGPTRADHLQFCLNEGWWLVHESFGPEGPDHLTYQLDLLDGRMLRTRIDASDGAQSYAPAGWEQVLGELACSASEFWDCVIEGIAPERPASPYQAVHLQRQRSGALDPDFMATMAARSRAQHPGRSLGR